MWSLHRIFVMVILNLKKFCYFIFFITTVLKYKKNSPVYKNMTHFPNSLHWHKINRLKVLVANKHVSFHHIPRWIFGTVAEAAKGRRRVTMPNPIIKSEVNQDDERRPPSNNQTSRKKMERLFSPSNLIFHISAQLISNFDINYDWYFH